jgi:hypothetical protein
MGALSYRRHAGHGVGEWIAHLAVRAAVYRVFFGLPLGLVVVLAGAALVFIVSRRRRRASR